MREYHGLPRVYGTTLIILALVIFVPLLGFISDLFTDLGNTEKSTNWSVIMVVWAIVATIITIFVMAVGADIAWYHDKNVNDTTSEQQANESKFKPKEEK